MRNNDHYHHRHRLFHDRLFGCASAQGAVVTEYDALEERLLEDCYCGGDNNLSGVDCVPCRAAAAIRELRAERDALRAQLESSQLQCKEARAEADRNNALVSELLDDARAYDAAIKGKPPEL